MTEYIKSHPVGFTLIILGSISVILVIIGLFVNATNTSDYISATNCHPNFDNYITNINIGNATDNTICIENSGSYSVPIYDKNSNSITSIYSSSPEITDTGLCINNLALDDDGTQYNNTICNDDLVAIDIKSETSSPNANYFYNNNFKCLYPSSTPTSQWTYAGTESLNVGMSGNLCPNIEYGSCKDGTTNNNNDGCKPTWLCVEYDNLSNIKKNNGRYLNKNEIFLGPDNMIGNSIRDDNNLVSGCQNSNSDNIYLYKNYKKYDKNNNFF